MPVSPVSPVGALENETREPRRAIQIHGLLRILRTASKWNWLSLSVRVLRAPWALSSLQLLWVNDKIKVHLIDPQIFHNLIPCAFSFVPVMVL